jgi:thiol:disulfide interchange protein
VPAAVTLVLAFAAAQASGVRAVGGVVLVMGVAWCVWRALPGAGPVRVGAVVLLGAACFVAAHVLAPALGPWPSVLLAAAVLGAGTALLVDRATPAT